VRSARLGTARLDTALYAIAMVIIYAGISIATSAINADVGEDEGEENDSDDDDNIDDGKGRQGWLYASCG